MTGKSDPYVVLSCQGRKYETKVEIMSRELARSNVALQVCRKTLDPVWEEEFWLDIRADMDPMINVQVVTTFSILKITVILNSCLCRCLTRISWVKMRPTVD